MIDRCQPFHRSWEGERVSWIELIYSVRFEDLRNALLLMSVYSNSHYPFTSCVIMMDPGPTISRSSSKDRLVGRSCGGEAAMLRHVHNAQDKRRLPGSICCCDA